MNHIGKLHTPKSCQGCLVFAQPLPTTVADSQTIKECIGRVLGDKRWWMTAEEFLAQVEAHRQAHDKERLNPKAANQTPAEVRDYWLDAHIQYTPKWKIAGHQEVAS